MKNCFCGCLASPCRDNKYCSERCAREDTKKMLMGEPSHYRSLSQVCDNLPVTCDMSNRLRRQRFWKGSSDQTLGVGLPRGS